MFKSIQFCCRPAQPIYHSNLYKRHSSVQAYVSCILRLHSSWGLCKANLSWINQEIPWCMLYVEEDILFRSRREVLPSLLKWTNLRSAVYLSTFWNTSKYLPDPCGCVPQTCRSPGLKNNSLITRGTGDFQVRSQAMPFTSPRKELCKWKNGPMWSPGQQDFCKAKEEGRRKNYSVSVLSTCILNPHKKVPYFLQVQSIAIDSFEAPSEYRMWASTPNSL